MSNSDVYSGTDGGDYGGVNGSGEPSEWTVKEYYDMYGERESAVDDSGSDCWSGSWGSG